MNNIVDIITQGRHNHLQIQTDINKLLTGKIREKRQLTLEKNNK